MLLMPLLLLSPAPLRAEDFNCLEFAGDKKFFDELATLNPPNPAESVRYPFQKDFYNTCYNQHRKAWDQGYRQALDRDHFRYFRDRYEIPDLKCGPEAQACAEYRPKAWSYESLGKLTLNPNEANSAPEFDTPLECCLAGNSAGERTFVNKLHDSASVQCQADFEAGKKVGEDIKKNFSSAAPSKTPGCYKSRHYCYRQCYTQGYNLTATVARADEFIREIKQKDPFKNVGLTLDAPNPEPADLPGISDTLTKPFQWGTNVSPYSDAQPTKAGAAHPSPQP